MSRAEESAWEVYPDYPSMDGGYVTQRKQRDLYIKGYRQAEKDIALTWQDIRKITQIYSRVTDEFLEKYFAQMPVKDEDIYQEVLKRFNKKR